MSTTSRNPQRAANACLNSGSLNTGELLQAQGGCIAASVYSGAVAPSLAGAYGAVAAGPDILLYSGAGRLKDILPHVQLLSGLPVVFYDAGAVASGGPFAASGHKIVGVLPGSTQSTAPAGSGVNIAIFPNDWVFALDQPFQSGLCVATKSGQPGFTVTYTPEANPALANPG